MRRIPEGALTPLATPSRPPAPTSLVPLTDDPLKCARCGGRGRVVAERVCGVCMGTGQEGDGVSPLELGRGMIFPAAYDRDQFTPAQEAAMEAAQDAAERAAEQDEDGEGA